MKNINFKVIGATTIKKWLEKNTFDMITTVEKVYAQFKVGDTVCPDSYFLRFPTAPNNRIIALPASIESGDKVSGIKWIASYPDNVSDGLDRASATIILNSKSTGYPIACLEGSLISAYRTACCAVVGAKYLHDGKKIESLAIVGAGLIASTTIKVLQNLNWEIKKIKIIDLSIDRAEHLKSKVLNSNVEVSTDISDIKNSDMILFTTSAIEPYVHDVKLFEHNPTVIHLSLRDLSTSIIKASQNFSDNEDHAIKAKTSLHLTEIEEGNRKFMNGDIVDLINKTIKPDFNKTRIFSPFGMGILDISIGYKLYQDSSIESDEIDNFFPEPYTTKNNI
ncbi:2,3-diaminopropionate biosynthesis protein SbnB [Aliivibrio fischeri]|uniref:2,3-diaminopropionate biosynthesis protein SbnB n=1 Tax=Aliivibrio fischeri TaxID=668 RepID=UPI0012D8D88A|nr:2,3-diaminopropionate biosynthesis protein SbnB [Aliivibrio fischeri]MUK29129.1 2,3-diaminopropionate biosynthesis protein SbnB [Aliivibrio fischeri]